MVMYQIRFFIFLKRKCHNVTLREQVRNRFLGWAGLEGHAGLELSLLGQFQT